MIKKWNEFNENYSQDKPLYKEPITGKEHSVNYDDIDSEFSKYLRQNYYNIKLSNEDVSLIKKKWKENL